MHSEVLGIRASTLGFGGTQLGPYQMGYTGMIRNGWIRPVTESKIRQKERHKSGRMDLAWLIQSLTPTLGGSCETECATLTSSSSLVFRGIRLARCYARAARVEITSVGQV